MRRHYLILSCLLLISCRLFAQKPALSVHEDGLQNWPAVGQPVLSNDGSYLLFNIRNQPAGRNTLIIRSTKSDWKTEISGPGGGSFTDDSQKALFMKGDSLCQLTLGSNTTACIPGVYYFQQFKQGNTEWLAIQKSDGLTLKNLATGKEVTYIGVSQFQVSPAANALVMTKEAKDSTGIRNTLTWLSLAEMKQATIIETRDELSNIVFDGAGGQLAFMVSKTEGTYDEVSFNRGMPEENLKPQISKKPNKINMVYRYQPGMESAQLWVDEHTAGIGAGLKIGGGGMHFSKDGARLFFKLDKVPVPLKMKENPVMVEVWSYMDAHLQPDQQLSPLSYMFRRPDDFIAVINRADNKVIQLQGPNDYFNFGAEGDDFIVIRTYRETNYNPSNDYFRDKPQVYLVSAVDGSRKPLQEDGILSPSGKYLYYFDLDKGHYFTYELSTGKSTNITAAVPFHVYYEDYNYGHGAKPNASDQSPLWLKDDQAVLISDTYDIWQVDPKGIKAPVNITNSYGHRHGITLRYIMAFGKVQVPGSGQQLLLGGFRQLNKNAGYFSKALGAPGDPEQLMRGAYVYGGIQSNLQGYAFLKRELPNPVKARDADVFIFSRQTEKDGPNLFLTKDFKQLTRLTDIQPQKHFNWYSTELVSWKKFDGKIAQGVLYKPENFDPKKKYPLIFWYYEKNASGLHSFLKPEASMGDLNIPYFVSNGYLVFVPDISYKLGAPGKSAYNAVVSAAQYIAKRPYVDAKRMGITGHSFGGYETNYLVTRTSMFAAALAANGPTDLVSGYGSLGKDGVDNHDFTENQQIRMGKTLWQDPQTYINNSPIFSADKVTTPLLIMHTKSDGAVRWPQAVEWFTALRRLNKRVWLLQYDNEDHNLWNPNARLDYTIRMTQFFDHYLKGAPAPVWMTRGIPAKLKGIDDGLSLDTTGATRRPGLLLPTNTKETKKPSK